MSGKGGSRSGGGGSRSSGGSGVVHVRGYTRANGTYVAGYTRSRPSSAGGSRSSSASTPSRASYHSSSTGGTVNVRGYTRSDGTHVAGYTRAAPGTSTSSGGSGVVHVRGYTRANGTYVAGYTRSRPSSAGGSRSSSASTTSRAPSYLLSTGGTLNVPGYTRSDGTYAKGQFQLLPDTKSKSSMPPLSKSLNDAVEVQCNTIAGGAVIPAHTMSKPTPFQRHCNSQDSATRTTATTPRYYKDNAFNRKLGRVGMPIRTSVLCSKKSVETPSAIKLTGDNPVCTFTDSAMNRQLGRVGKPIPPRRHEKIREAIEDNTIEELRECLEQLLSKPNSFYEEQAYALQLIHHQEVEEKWKAMDVEPSTDVSRLSQLHVQGQIIPLKELHLDKQEIGRGGFGAVYAGCWHKTPISFKRLHHQNVSKRHLESFKAEVAVFAAVDHPHIVHMLGVVVEAGNIGIVMEYMTQSLYHAIFIKGSEFSEMEKKRIVYQMASAVKYLHTHDPKIVHCDIKSENVLLDGDNNVKLTDFGLSTMKNMSNSSQSNFGAGAATPGKGTPRYSAPEVLRGEILKMDKLLPTDIYSLSLVVYEVVAEEETFEGLSIKQLEVNVGSGNLRPFLPDTLSKPLIDFLKKSWDEDPPKRPTAAEFESSWRDIPSLYTK